MSEQKPQKPQEPIDDETLWGSPDETAQQGEDAVLPAEIDDAQTEAEIILDDENGKQKSDQEQE